MLSNLIPLLLRYLQSWSCHFTSSPYSARDRSGGLASSAVRVILRRNSGAALVLPADAGAERCHAVREHRFGSSEPAAPILPAPGAGRRDPAKRRELHRQIFRYIIDQAYSIPIGNLPEYELWQPYVKNYAPSEALRSAIVTRVWLDK